MAARVRARTASRVRSAGAFACCRFVFAFARVQARQQLPQELELCDRVVSSENGLPAFQAGNADADVRRLNHRHIVGTVADR